MITEWLIRHSNLDEYQGRKREVAKLGVRLFLIVMVLVSVFAATLAYSNDTVVEMVSKVLG